MATQNVVTLENLGSGFDIGVTEAGKISIQLSLDSETIYSEQFAGGDNGVNGSAIWARNSTVTRTGEGLYTVVFDSSHPDGINYHVSLSGSEDVANRDNPKVTLVYPTKTANGFDLMVTVDDNGTGADPLEDNGWSYGVDSPLTVITNVETTTA